MFWIPKLDIAYPQLSLVPIRRALLPFSIFIFKQLDLPFQLSLHNKSRTDHRQQFRIILQCHQINTYMIANIPLINKTNNCIYWWMWFHNRLSSNKQQYDFINLRKKICKFVNLNMLSKGSKNHQGIDIVYVWIALILLKLKNYCWKHCR